MSSERSRGSTKALRLFLRPIARYCLRHSIKLQELVEQLKASLLEVALDEIKRRDKKPTASRLAIMTGVHRKDVTRIIERGESKSEDVALPARIIGQWRTRPEFLGLSGRPRTLTVEGSESEFAGLVRSVSKELNPYTLLFELERSGAVERAGDRLKLLTQVYTPRGDKMRSLEMLATDAEDLYEAVQENVFNQPAIPNLHVTTTYDNISSSAVKQIRSWFLAEGEKLHQRAREYLARFDVDSNPKLRGHAAGVKVALGAFSRVIEPDRKLEK